MKKGPCFAVVTNARYYGRTYESVMLFDNEEAAQRRLRRNLDRAYRSCGCDSVQQTMLSADAAALDGINRKGHAVHHEWKVVDATLWHNRYGE